MGELEYQEALKSGRKEYKARVAKGQFPYLPVLDQIVSQKDIQTEQNMGLVNIPLDFVVGTATMGRTYSFAANFMPILEEESEFCFKWANLSDAQVNEGIRDPIKVYEYMNRYYVLEGNKRVSVLKFYNAVYVPAYVTRKIPKYSEDEDVKLYYEYMKFNEVTGIFIVEFSKPGNAQRLLDLVGKEDRWDEKTKEDFGKVMYDFAKVYEFRGGKRLPITLGDAIVAFMSIFGFEEMLKMSAGEYSNNIVKVWNEFGVQAEKEAVDLVMNPSKQKAKPTDKFGLFKFFIPSKTKKFTVAFLYPKSPDESDWIYAHELGRNYLEETFPDELQTISVDNVTEKNITEVLEGVIKKGANIVFGVAPQMMMPSLKVAIEHPEVKILNCSLNTPHQYIRTYYGRMYEAKFLSGAIAGILADNNKIAYIADYPIYGMIANINAFALGALCTNPRAKIYLAWSTAKDYDRDKFLRENDLHYVSDQDMITPKDLDRQFGLYKIDDGKTVNLAMTVWNWGIFYQKLIQSVLAGSYQNEGDEKKGLNYWWGMSAGVIDLICSNNVPYSVRRLAFQLKEDLCDGSMVPFFGEIYSQSGELMNKEHQRMNPIDIMNMDYLVENVIGEIPTRNDVIDDAKEVVELKGVEDNKQK